MQIEKIVGLVFQIEESTGNNRTWLFWRPRHINVINLKIDSTITNYRSIEIRLWNLWNVFVCIYQEFQLNLKESYQKLFCETDENVSQAFSLGFAKNALLVANIENSCFVNNNATWPQSILRMFRLQMECNFDLSQSSNKNINKYDNFMIQYSWNLALQKGAFDWGRWVIVSSNP